MPKQIKIKKAVKATDLYVHVTCPLCDKQFRFVPNPNHSKICSGCGKIDFRASVENIPGYIRVGVIGVDNVNRIYMIEPDEVEIDET